MTKSVLFEDIYQQVSIPVRESHLSRKRQEAARKPLNYFFARYPCHNHSSASGNVCCFTERSVWPAFLAKTNW